LRPRGSTRRGTILASRVTGRPRCGDSIVNIFRRVAPAFGSHQTGDPE